MTIVHLVCLIASHEWKDTSLVLKSQILYLPSIPWIFLMKIFYQGLFGKIQLSQSHQKRKSFKVQRSLKWKDFIIIHLRQGLKWNTTYLGNSYVHLWILLYQGIISHHSQASNGRLWKIHLRNIFNISITLFLIKSSRIWSKLIS
jgi:hypothetical protein